MKLQASDLQPYQKEALTQVFSCEICEISKNTSFTENLWTTASVKTFQDGPTSEQKIQLLVKSCLPFAFTIF